MTTPTPGPDVASDRPAVLPAALVEVLRAPATCFLATLMPDGAPQISQTWVDTDGVNIIINSVTTHQKARNVDRDPHVAVGVTDPAHPARSWAIRGRVTSATTDGGTDHIDRLSRKYLGRPYSGFGGGTGRRVILTITPDTVHAPRA